MKCNQTPRIAHISDLHLPLSGPVPMGKLLGKRVLGYANLRLFRRSHRLEHLESLLRGLKAEEPDLVVITGDLSSLSLESEFARLDRIFTAAGLRPESTLVLPGNHDRYTPGADRSGAFERGMRRWLPEGFRREGGYPIVRRVGPVAVVGLDTAVWRGAYRAAGRIERAQLDRLAGRLQRIPADGPLVIAMHHPPYRLRGPLLQHHRVGLVGHEGLFETLAGRPAVVLHGHLHRLGRRRIGNADVIGVSSASIDTGDPATQLAFHLYRFDATGLVQARIVRHWPKAHDSEMRWERTDLPVEVEEQVTSDMT